MAPLAGLVGARWWPKGAPRAEKAKNENVKKVLEGIRQVEPGSALEWSLVVSGGLWWWRWWVVIRGGEKLCKVVPKGEPGLIASLELAVELGGRGD